MNQNIVYLELGVGFNTPGIIKYSFGQVTMQNPNAIYVCKVIKYNISPDVVDVISKELNRNKKYFCKGKTREVKSHNKVYQIIKRNGLLYFLYLIIFFTKKLAIHSEDSLFSLFSHIHTT